MVIGASRVGMKKPGTWPGFAGLLVGQVKRETVCSSMSVARL